MYVISGTSRRRLDSRLSAFGWAVGTATRVDKMNPTRVPQVAAILQYRGVNVQGVTRYWFYVDCIAEYGHIYFYRSGGVWGLVSPDSVDTVLTSKSIMVCITFARLQGWIK